MIQVQSKTDILTKVAELIDAGQVRTYVEKVFPLTEAAQAHTFSQQGHTRGKIVLQVV